MGYKIPRRIALLVLHDDFEGGEIQVYLDVPMIMLFEIERLWESPGRGAVREMLRIFTEAALIEWNLEDNDGPIPATAEGITHLPLSLILRIITVWRQAVTELPVPLAQPSDDGLRLAEASIVMGSSLASQPN